MERGFGLCVRTGLDGKPDHVRKQCAGQWQPTARIRRPKWGRWSSLETEMLSMSRNTFGETQIYYRAFNPQAGSYQRKVGLLKRAVAQGVPVIVGAGYHLD